MPIPAFDGILNVLPPHLGNPCDPSQLSPYHCTIVELCSSFDSSNARKEILNGFLNLREALFSLGIFGFQWLGGSFLENIEVQEARPPNDIDAVTIVDAPSGLAAIDAILAGKPEIYDNAVSKAKYKVDHFILPLASAPVSLVLQSRYWYGLFSHRRDSLWKGMLKVDLLDKAEDDAARIALGANP